MKGYNLKNIQIELYIPQFGALKMIAERGFVFFNKKALNCLIYEGLRFEILQPNFQFEYFYFNDGEKFFQTRGKPEIFYFIKTANLHDFFI